MPAPRVLEPLDEYSILPSQGNRLIEGDNLQVMVSLRSQYRSRVDVAYLDPPYNTGRNDFRYSDARFRDPNADSSDAVYVSNEDGGRHTKWLNFMAPRLRLTWELLADHGICLVSINDIELFRLGMLMDEIFGEKNRLGVVVWKQAADNNPTRIAVGHEYILAYAKRAEDVPKVWYGDSPAQLWLLDTYERLKEDHPNDLRKLQTAYQIAIRDHVAAFKEAAANSDQQSDLVDLGDLARYDLLDQRGPYAANRTTENPRVPGYFYEVKNPKNNRLHPQPGRGYRFPEETMRWMQEEDRIIYPSDARRLVQIKKYLRELRPPLRGIIEIGSRGGAADLKRLLSKAEADRFPNPKPTPLMELLLDFAGDADALVLDAWAGSGTTGHAVLRLNEKDGGNRRFILVEEGTREDRFTRSLTAKRLRSAIEKEGLSGGFSFETTGSKVDREVILELEREAIANLVIQTDVTGLGRGIKKIDVGYFIGVNSRNEGIALCWQGRERARVDRNVLRKIFEEARDLGLNKPLRVYGTTCTVGETDSFRFCQIPDEILASLQAAEEEAESEDQALAEGLQVLEDAVQEAHVTSGRTK